jgi:hypothetical protein
MRIRGHFEVAHLALFVGAFVAGAPRSLMGMSVSLPCRSSTISALVRMGLSSKMPRLRGHPGRYGTFSMAVVSWIVLNGSA